MSRSVPGADSTTVPTNPGVELAGPQRLAVDQSIRSLPVVDHTRVSYETLILFGGGTDGMLTLDVQATTIENRVPPRYQ